MDWKKDEFEWRDGGCDELVALLFWTIVLGSFLVYLSW